MYARAQSLKVPPRYRPQSVLERASYDTDKKDARAAAMGGKTHLPSWSDKGDISDLRRGRAFCSGEASRTSTQFLQTELKALRDGTAWSTGKLQSAGEELGCDIITTVIAQ